MKNFGKNLGCLLVSLWLLTTTLWAEPLKAGAEFSTQGLEVTMTHYEMARTQPVVFVHFVVRNGSAQKATCDWRDLVYLIESDGTKISSNFDALVDAGNGMSRTSGPFPIERGRKAKIAVPFLLSEESLPAVLELVDGRRSPPLRRRGVGR